MGRPAVDHSGRTYGRLDVIRRSGVNASGNVLWECQCSCGEVCSVSGSALVTGNTRSCGCLQREWASGMPLEDHHRTHGESNRTSEYRAWVNMRGRCTNPRDPGFKNYGGRGITICGRWDDYSAFLSDMGRKPGPGYSIDRVNNDGNYEPGNCRWATRDQQNSNKRKKVAVA